MPTIVVTSDLHLGITSEAILRSLAERIAAEQPALTVLAGDLGEPLNRFIACLRLFAKLPGQVAVLAGNHDVWARGGYTSRKLWVQYLPEATRAAGMLWLEEENWQQDDLAVAGSLAWYDYSAADPLALSYPAEFFALQKGRFNADAHYIDWGWADREVAQHMGDALCARLEALEDDPAIRSVLVASHVPLFEAQMCRKSDDAGWGFSNAYFGNLTLGRRVLEMRKLRAVVSGHTHVGREGLAARTPESEPIPVLVVPSEYRAPAYVVIETSNWRWQVKALNGFLC